MTHPQTGGGGAKCSNQEIIKNVTPTQQAAEIAQSEIDRERGTISTRVTSQRKHSAKKTGSVKKSKRTGASKEALTELEKIFKKKKSKST